MKFQVDINNGEDLVVAIITASLDMIKTNPLSVPLFSNNPEVEKKTVDELVKSLRIVREWYSVNGKVEEEINSDYSFN